MEIKGRTLTDKERENCKNGVLSNEEKEVLKKIIAEYNKILVESTFAYKIGKFFKK